MREGGKESKTQTEKEMRNRHAYRQTTPRQTKTKGDTENVFVCKRE